MLHGGDAEAGTAGLGWQVTRAGAVLPAQMHTILYSLVHLIPWLITICQAHAENGGALLTARVWGSKRLIPPTLPAG